MKPNELDRHLSQAYAPEGRNHTRHRRELEDELRARHGQLYPRKRWTMLKQTTWFRPVMAMLAVMILGIAACNAPTEYDVQMGQKMNITFENPAKFGADGTDNNLDAVLDQIVGFVDIYPGVEAVSVNVSEMAEGPLTMGLMVWGQSLDGAALQQDLIAEFPLLNEAEFAVDPLEGTVEGTLGEAMGHALFNLEVEGEDAEDIRQQILAQLAEQGFTGDAVVDVQMEDGQTTINVELTEDVEEADGSDGQTSDVMVIERKTE